MKLALLALLPRAKVIVSSVDIFRAFIDLGTPRAFLQLLTLLCLFRL